MNISAQLGDQVGVPQLSKEIMFLLQGIQEEEGVFGRLVDMVVV